MSPFIKALHAAFLLSLTLFLISGFLRYRLPDLPEILPQTYQEPLQTETDKTPLKPQRKDGKYLYDVEPLFDYELYGLVVSFHHSKNDRGFSNHEDWGDFLNTADLCIIWGENLRSKVYQKMSFSNGDWTCYPKFKMGGGDWSQFNISSLSNNHLLPRDLNVEKIISAARPGDQIHLKGKLVQYKRKDMSSYRTSSTTREDYGCEVIYVTFAKILKSGNLIWRILYGFSAGVLLLLGTILLVHYLKIKEIIIEVFNK